MSDHETDTVELSWAGRHNLSAVGPRFSLVPYFEGRFSNFDSAIECIRKTDELRDQGKVLQITRLIDNRIWDDLEIARVLQTQGRP